MNFFIRGRPWTIAVDDYLFMYNEYGISYKTAYPQYNVPAFAQPSPDLSAIWGPVFEKAWAKVKGNYLIAEGGFNQEAISAIAGIPLYTYSTSSIDSTFFNTMLTADQNQYILAA